MKVLVLGGGPAGMAAAIAAARGGAEVSLLERNDRIGKKLLLTGNGKCNFTNLDLRPERYDCDVPSLLSEVLEPFPPETVIRFLEELGVPPLTRHGTWIYPHAEQAAAVLNALRAELERRGVKIETDARILGVRHNKKGGFTVKTERAEFHADRVVAALGGTALPKTGSDGSGAAITALLGLKSLPFRPALCPLRSAERENAFFRAAQGVRVPAALSLWVDGKKTAEEAGELQLTKEGFSGISVFQLSLPAGRALQNKQKAELVLNFLPDLKTDFAFFAKRGAQPFATTLEAYGNGLVPKNLWLALLRRAGLSAGMAPGSLRKAELAAIAEQLTAARFPIQGLASYDKAQVSAGGISLRELDPRTLGAKQIPGLYFAGEMLNVTGPCGGYNLHWCFASGLLAGQSAANDEVLR